MLSNNKKRIAVIGATGQQGGAAVYALPASSEGAQASLPAMKGAHK
jgi:uncharacterized protein YbjT (DUF2867 family)